MGGINHQKYGWFIIALLTLVELPLGNLTVCELENHND
jgi:hypothetical protein